MFNNCQLSRLVPEQARRYGDRTAMFYRDYDLGKWIPVSWNQFARKVTQMSRALLSFGIREQENIGVFSQNKPENLYCDFGAFGVRAVSIPFYATSSGAQVTYMINDAKIRLLFVGEQQQYDIAFSVLALCPTLEKIVIFDPKVVKHPKDHLSAYFDEFLKAGNLEPLDTEVERRQANVRPEDTANILYTSGTTGNSKGVILTYGMFQAALEAHARTLDVREDDLTLNFLPFTHVFERGWAFVCLSHGARLAINLRPQDVLQSLQEIHPTCMCSVPRFWEKVYQGVLDKMESGSFVERRLIKNALELGSRRWTEYVSQGKSVPLWMQLKYEMYDKTVIKLLRKTLGLDNPHIFPTAGAAVSAEVETFVHAAGIGMVVGYGLTETMAAVSFDRLGEQVVTKGSAGRLLPGLEIKFGADNEILLKGPTITPGYYNKESATKEAFTEDGWFRTGDAGYMKDGELFLTERIKDLFKTSNGKYIAPQMIESKLVLDRCIEQAVIVADQHKFVSALLVPAYGLLEKFAAENGISCASREELCRHPRIHQMIAERIDTLQQDLAHYEQVKRFVLLPTPFTMESGELTNTLKVKRRVVYERYAREIAKMYEEAAPQS